MNIDTKIAVKILLIFILCVFAIKFLWFALFGRNPTNTKLLNAVADAEHTCIMCAFASGVLVILSL